MTVWNRHRWCLQLVQLKFSFFFLDVRNTTMALLFMLNQFEIHTALYLYTVFPTVCLFQSTLGQLCKLKQLVYKCPDSLAFTKENTSLSSLCHSLDKKIWFKVTPLTMLLNSRLPLHCATDLWGLTQYQASQGLRDQNMD